MAGCKKQARSDQSSIEYRSNPAKVASFDFVHQECAPALSDDDKQINKKYEPKSNKPLSTKELIAAVGELWDSANRLPLFHPKVNPTGNHSGCKKEILGNLDKEGSSQLPLSVGSKYFCIDVSRGDQFSHTVQPNLEFFKLNQKMSVFESCSKKYSHSALLRFLQGGATLTYDIGNGGLASVGISHESGNIYPWMTETASAAVRYSKGIPEIEKREVGDHYIPGDSTDCSGSFISGDTHSPACNPVAKDANVSLGLIKSKDQSSHVSTKLVMNTGITRSLLSDYFLKDVSAMKEDCNITSRPHSSLYGVYCINSLASSNGSYEKCQHLIQDDELLQNKREQPEKCVIEDKSKMAFNTLKNEKPQFGLAKQEHAAAGALAGIFVSFCLHPVDTIKTVIQSCRAEQKSIFLIGRSIVSERGLSGLYRGIASNIASSAPTSAVYTFTYESVKGALLPHFPREFHSLAHCMAGGCASVATSFIFTPSERIKQQMQVGSHYRNCWNALVGIIKKGGLPSLYAGWGAVLCRNVPHSIIKFYTYESLKKMMLPSSNSAAQPNTKQTLVCGGLAGSTAALFTTPFDVVKTRLQTQIPGSRSRYHSVYHALQEIGKQEGLKGLYRGLIPRLVMYMSQGAIFFTSYEFFKRLLSLDVPQLNSQRIQSNQNKGVPGSSQSPFPAPSSTSATALSPSRPSLHSSHS